MDDLETREALSILAHRLREQMVYAQNLHQNLLALYDALKKADPDLENRFHLAAAQPRVWQEYENSIHGIDALIEQLQLK